MAATFGDPLTLAKHDISPKTSYEVAPVLASCSKGSKTEYATIGVHGEGINIIDLTSLQTEAATLLGPNASFACPPVTRVIEKGKTERARQTYAILSSTPAKSSTKRSQTLSLWSSNEGLASLQQDHSATVSPIPFAEEHPLDTTLQLTTSAAVLYAPDSVSDKVILLSPEGVITTYDSTLQQSEEEIASHRSQQLLFSFIFDSANCSFARGSNYPSTSRRAIVVTLLKRRKETYVRVCSVGQHTETVGETLVHLQDNNIVSANCDKDGCLSLIDENGALFSYIIESRKDGISLLPLEQLALRGIDPTSVSIICLGSTHVLVAGFEKQHPDIVLLVLDVQYGVSLAEKKLPRPGPLSTISPEHLQLHMTSCDTSQTVLVISSKKSGSKKDSSASGLKAVVMIIPHSVPMASSLAGAIGRASASEKWLVLAALNPTSGSKTHQDGREAVLTSITRSIEAGKGDVADRIFFEWEAEQKTRVKALAKEETKRQMAALAPKRMANGNSAASDSEDAHPDPKVHIKHVPIQIEWGHSFLARLMQVVLRPTGIHSGPPGFLSKIPSYFLERRLISDGIVEGGVLKALKDREDWESIRWVLRNTVDVSEDHLAATLLHSVHLHRKRSKGENEMDVDQATSVSTRVPFPIPQVLGHVIGYPTSAPPLRLAIRQHFSQMDDVVVLLEIINSWITESAKKSLTIKLGDVNEELKRGEQTNNERAVEKDGLPRLDLLVSFVACMLDAVLLDLLQYRKAHRPLRILYKRLAPYAPYLEGLDQLRGPLEPFVLADRRSRRPWEDPKKAQKGRDRKEDNHALNVNLYQVEEFFV